MEKRKKLAKQISGEGLEHLQNTSENSFKIRDKSESMLILKLYCLYQL